MATPNSGSEPGTSTARKPSTTTFSDRLDATSTTTAIDHSLESMISRGVTGITSRCSMVPCSRSRISAAPVSRMPSWVTLLITAVTAANQAALRLGLNRLRGTSSTGGGGAARPRWAKARISSATMLWM